MRTTLAAGLAAVCVGGLIVAGCRRPVGAAPQPSAPLTLATSEQQNPVAPEFKTGLVWLNVDHPLTLKELRGKVVLLDFWTFG